MKKMSEHAPLKVAQDKLNELQHNRDKIERELNLLRAPKASKGMSQEEIDARKLLGEDIQGFDRQKEATLTADLRAHRKAIEIQARVVDNERAVACKLVCQSRRPQYAAIVKKLKAAAEALRIVATEEVAFRDELIAEGVSFSGHIPPVPFISPEHIEGWIVETAKEYK